MTDARSVLTCDRRLTPKLRLAPFLVILLGILCHLRYTTLRSKNSRSITFTWRTMFHRKHCQAPWPACGRWAIGGCPSPYRTRLQRLNLVDELDDTARRIGCINTVINDAGVLHGRNSDGLGALGALRAAAADPSGKHVVVLGSGGAARAIAITLVAEASPRQLTLLGIDEPELNALAATLREQEKSEIQVGRSDSATLPAALESADLLVQTTPLGMAPNVERSAVPAEFLHPRLTVFDAVYTPRQTRLLREATQRGCRTIEGLEMFLGQAIVQFEAWTGHQAPTAVMRGIIEQRLG